MLHLQLCVVPVFELFCHYKVVTGVSLMSIIRLFLIVFLLLFPSKLVKLKNLPFTHTAFAYLYKHLYLISTVKSIVFCICCYWLTMTKMFYKHSSVFCLCDYMLSTRNPLHKVFSRQLTYCLWTANYIITKCSLLC